MCKIVQKFFAWKNGLIDYCVADFGKSCESFSKIILLNACIIQINVFTLHSETRPSWQGGRAKPVRFPLKARERKQITGREMLGTASCLTYVSEYPHDKGRTINKECM